VDQKVYACEEPSPIYSGSGSHQGLQALTALYISLALILFSVLVLSRVGLKMTFLALHPFLVGFETCN
jgi:hypothetical protein